MAIIGGGSVGLVCVNSVQEGTRAVIFEKTSGVGGLWQIGEERMSV